MSDVFHTNELSANGLVSILETLFDKFPDKLTGRVAVKLHTGERNGPNIIPPEWVYKVISLAEQAHEDYTIVETNTFYVGDRDTTEKHRRTLDVNGWTFCRVDILDASGEREIPVPNGKYFSYLTTGNGLFDYDSMLVLTHFKGHQMAGFGGSIKNIGIGCASGKTGKAQIHGNHWEFSKDSLLERMVESASAIINHFQNRMLYINIGRNMSVDCDCAGTSAAPVATPNIGIYGSDDIVSVDQACIDAIYKMPESDKKYMVNRIESQHGLSQLQYASEIGLGSKKYNLIEL